MLKSPRLSKNLSDSKQENLEYRIYLRNEWSTTISPNQNA